MPPDFPVRFCAIQVGALEASRIASASVYPQVSLIRSASVETAQAPQSTSITLYPSPEYKAVLGSVVVTGFTIVL